MRRSVRAAHLRAHGCQFRCEGAKHTIWENPATGWTTAVPRHCEVNDITTRKICRDLQVPAP